MSDAETKRLFLLSVRAHGFRAAEVDADARSSDKAEG
jgi:hypothetical protein